MHTVHVAEKLYISGEPSSVEDVIQTHCDETIYRRDSVGLDYYCCNLQLLLLLYPFNDRRCIILLSRPAISFGDNHFVNIIYWSPLVIILAIITSLRCCLL